MIGSGAGGDDEAEGGEKAESVGGKGVGGAAEDGSNGRRAVVGDDELMEWEA